ncbi:MAG: prolyl-tRNA synthetase associated domain-containing protein [Clostridia bacterium]|nr:prolyl-tRNA synthetase associated domain-containing protein [Clostridia bacterium]
MSEIISEIFETLTEMGIVYEKMEHAAAATMDDCRVVEETLRAVMPKNIFLCPRRKSCYWLLLTRPNARYKTADISKQLGVSRLSFGPEEELYDFLRTTPGAITPMGLMFDGGKMVRLAVDSALRDAEKLAFHPCDNTMSLAMSGADFFGKYLPALGIEPVFVEIHDFLNDEDM